MRTSAKLTFLEMLMSCVPHGAMLDTLALERMPEPWLVTAPLGVNAEERMLRAPGLQGKRIVAATTARHDLIKTFIDGPNPSVKRALPYNPNLNAKQALALAKQSVDRRDGALVLHLIYGRRDLGSLLANQPSMLDFLSRKIGHPGVPAVERSLLLLSAKELKVALAHLQINSYDVSRHSKMAYPLGECRKLLRLSKTEPFRECLTGRDFDEEAVLSLCETLPIWLRRELIEAVATDPRVSAAETVLLMSEPLENWKSTTGWRGAYSWDTTWSEVALWAVARRCAAELLTPASFCLFESMVADWDADLLSLTQVCALAN